MKNLRLLDIYVRLLNNRPVNKKQISEQYEISERSVQRDISAIKDFLIFNGQEETDIILDKNKNSYVLKEDENQKLNNSEILAICKILLDSRAFLKPEMDEIINKLMRQCIPVENYDKVRKLVENEKFHYMELNHKKSFINSIWEIGEAVQNHLKVKISYQRLDKKIVERTIKPVGIMFSEYYFYLLGHIDKIDKEKYFQNKDDVFPTIYRFDRIDSFEILDEHFQVLYGNRFEEGEFRKRIQFMTGGKLRKITFKYFGEYLEAVLDKIPTAEIIEKQDGYVVIKAEVFGSGIDRWILSQGKDVEVID